jgi:lysine/ornithine N-monooxygenase
MTSLIAPDEHLHQVPDVLGDDIASFLPPDGTRRRTIAVVGSGYSAATTLGNLLDLAASRGHTYHARARNPIASLIAPLMI